MQLNQTQPSPLTVLLQLNFCYQVQTTIVSPDAHPSSYSGAATTLYPTLVQTCAKHYTNTVTVREELLVVQDCHLPPFSPLLTFFTYRPVCLRVLEYKINGNEQ
jgi:hypothetical protein